MNCSNKKPNHYAVGKVDDSNSIHISGQTLQLAISDKLTSPSSPISISYHSIGDVICEMICHLLHILSPGLGTSTGDHRFSCWIRRTRKNIWKGILKCLFTWIGRKEVLVRIFVCKTTNISDPEILQSVSVKIFLPTFWKQLTVLLNIIMIPNEKKRWNIQLNFTFIKF